MVNTRIIILAFSIALFSQFVIASTDSDPTSTPTSSNVSFTGKVLDSNSGESLAGVEVSIQNTDLKTYTDLDGNFTFKNLPSGTYDIILSLISYNKSLLDDVVIENGKTTSLDIKLLINK